MMAGFTLAIIHGRITQARDTQIPIDDTEGDIMDWNAFTVDVVDTLNNGFETDSAGSVTEDGLYIAIGETWIGTLFGYEENNYGQRAYHQFDTEAEQRQWFDAVAFAINDNPADW
jgi:hypothetical protein